LEGQRSGNENPRNGHHPAPLEGDQEDVVKIGGKRRSGGAKKLWPKRDIFNRRSRAVKITRKTGKKRGQRTLEEKKPRQTRTGEWGKRAKHCTKTKKYGKRIKPGPQENQHLKGGPQAQHRSAVQKKKGQEWGNGQEHVLSPKRDRQNIQKKEGGP